MLWVQRLGLMLGKVMEAHAMADRSRAFIGRQDAGQHLEQGTLSCTIFSDERHALSAFHREIQRCVDDLFPVPFTDALQIQHMTPAGRGQGELEFDALGVPLQFNQLDLFQLLDARLDLAGLVGLIPEPIDELLDPRHLFRLTGGGCLKLGITSSTELAEFGVVTAELLDGLVANFPHMGGDVIEKSGVVADDEQCQF